MQKKSLYVTLKLIRTKKTKVFLFKNKQAASFQSADEAFTVDQPLSLSKLYLIVKSRLEKILEQFHSANHQVALVKTRH